MRSTLQSDRIAFNSGINMLLYYWIYIPFTFVSNSDCVFSHRSVHSYTHNRHNTINRNCIYNKCEFTYDYTISFLGNATKI